MIGNEKKAASILKQLPICLCLEILEIFKLSTKKLSFLHMGAMKCFHFSNGEKKEEPHTFKSSSAMSNSTGSTTDRDMRRSGSGFNSQNISNTSAESTGRPQYPSFSHRPSNLRVFTFSELNVATRNFSRSLMVGEGGFGCVYRGTIRSINDPNRKIEIAVKQLSRKGLQIIFRDFKTSNILLDENWTAKLSDFGLARQGPEEGLTHVSTAVVGTIGYAAPEYMQTGHLTAKSDIWSYGIVLYELITGRPPIDRNRPRGEQKLLDWVKPYISDVKKFRMILDPRLDARQALKTATELSAIANKCLAGRARSRPKMSEVLDMVQRLVESAELGAPQPPLANPAVQEAQSDGGKKRGLDLKGMIGDMKMGDGRRLVWRGWTPKLTKTCG